MLAVVLVTTVAPTVGIVAFQSGILKRPTLGVSVLSALPGIVWLLLFYSLAIHMHQSLGGWPDQLGYRGFSDALRVHAEITSWSFSAMLLFSLFGWPVALAVTAWVKRWRRFAAGLTIYAISFSAVWLLMFATPARFRNWWWD